MLEPTAADQALLIGFDRAAVRAGDPPRARRRRRPRTSPATPSVVWEASGPTGALAGGDRRRRRDRWPAARERLRSRRRCLRRRRPRRSANTSCTGCAAGRPHRPAIGSLRADVVGATVAGRPRGGGHRGVARRERGRRRASPIRSGTGPCWRSSRARRSRCANPAPMSGSAGSRWRRSRTATGGDRHFVLDLIRGEVRFGPAIRQPDGGWRQFGAVPPAGSALRFTRYRYGGGRAGNVAAGALTIARVRRCAAWPA